MLTIRPEQMEALRRPVQERFEERMLVHLKMAFSRHIEGLTGDELRTLIRQGIVQAAEYGVVLAPDVSRYIEYRVCYGAGFDRDPKRPWITEILRSSTLSGTAKMDRIDARDRVACGVPTEETTKR